MESAPWWPTQLTTDEKSTNCSTLGRALVSSCRCQAPIAFGRTQRFQLSPVCKWNSTQLRQSNICNVVLIEALSTTV